jgi:hypothetical protein
VTPDPRVKVSIEVLPLRYRAVLRFVEAQGHQDVKVLKKKSQLVFETDFKSALYLLTELKHKFPLAYVSGSTEPA